MPSTFTNLNYHIIFSTKKRQPFLSTKIRKRLFSYIQGIAKKHHFKILSINAIEDHIHILLSIKTTVPLSKVVQVIKGNSSKWIHNTFKELTYFSWQEGYGAFTVSYSLVDVVRKYIKYQEEHHKNINFEIEYKMFLSKHDINFDNKYVF
jgi:putative transposase